MRKLTWTPVALSTTRSGAVCVLTCSAVTFCCSLLRRELLGLVLLLKRADQLVELAIDDIRELVERQIDAMVGDTALRKVVCADPLGAVAAADLELARLRL